MLKPLLFIYNPYAGKKEVVNHLHLIIDRLTKHGFKVSVHPTQFDNDAYNIVKTYGSNYEYVVCAGGDGTLNEVIHGVLELEEKPRLGYIPHGSANDFAVSRRIPLNSSGALDNFLEGMPTKIDVGQLNQNKYFNYIAAFGLFTDVPYDTPQDVKNIFGHSAYLLEGLKRLTHIKPIDCTIELEGKIVQQEILLGMITNSASVAGFKFPKDSFYENENFHLIMLKYSENLADYQGLAAVLMGMKEPGERFIVSPIDKVKITSPEPIAWTIDGEFGGRFCENEVIIHKQAVEIMLPLIYY